MASRKAKKPKGRDKLRGFRCSDEIWESLQAAAVKFDIPVAEILRRGGMEYVKKLERRQK